MEPFSNTLPLDIPLLKTDLRSISVLRLYRPYLDTTDNVLEENIWFEKQLTKDEAIKCKKSLN